MSDAIITLDELIEQTTPMTPTQRLEHMAGYLSDAAQLLATTSESFATLSRAMFELVNTWRTSAEDQS